jgi:two-component sensor histidine kinase
LYDVAHEALEHYLLEEKNRVLLKGPPVALDPKTALALGIVFHELATNAIKHGALSNQDGIVEVNWGCNGDGTVALRWQEDKGPKVLPPNGTGFGSRLIKLEMTHELNGEVELIYDPAGLKVTLGFPLGGHLTATQPKQGIAQ